MVLLLHTKTLDLCNAEYAKDWDEEGKATLGRRCRLRCWKSLRSIENCCGVLPPLVFHPDMLGQTAKCWRCRKHSGLIGRSLTNSHRWISNFWGAKTCGSACSFGQTAKFSQLVSYPAFNGSTWKECRSCRS